MKFLHKKSLGQNFLNNSRVPKRMADAAEVGKGDVVLEIGPGTGALTSELLGRGARVYAVETDVRAVEVLKERFAQEIETKQLLLFSEDIKTLELTSLRLKSGEFKVVSNIPYYLSGFLFRKLLDSTIQPSVIVFLIQKEVAERIARSEKESLLSLSVKAFGDPIYIETVKRGNFTPQPKVDSAIVLVKNIGYQKLSDVEVGAFFALIHEGFKSKRKQLLGNLASKYTRETLTHTFSTIGLPLDVRAEDLSFEKWLLLCRKLSSE